MKVNTNPYNAVSSIYLLHYYRNLTCCLPTWIPNIKDSFYEFSEKVLRRSINAKVDFEKILYFISGTDISKKKREKYFLKRIHYRYSKLQSVKD